MSETTTIEGIKHWRLERDGDGVAWLTFDMAGSSANVLSSETLDELSAVIDILRDDKPTGLIITSAKAGGFIAGADIKEFVALDDHMEAYRLIRRGQAVFDRLETLTYPTVAMIKGFCLGGGLELALACRYRVACDDEATKLGLPEVMLGIHPGFGGTVRLTRTVDLQTAMDMMLTGRNVAARRALKTGLVDFAVPERHLKNVAKGCISTPPKKKKLPFTTKLASYKTIRPFIAKNLHKKVEVKAPVANYPAPHAVIDIWAEHFGDQKKMLEAEAWSVADLIIGDTAKNLVRLFFLRERLKSIGKSHRFAPERVHVIGAGVMGGDIAAWCALKGLRVTLQDKEASFIAPAVKRAHDLFTKVLKDDRLVQAAMDRFQPDPGGRCGLPIADVVIEAIFEDGDAKRRLFKEIEGVVKKGALLATNTSSIPLEEIAGALSTPSRLVGIHFFNPVARMQLIEIVAGEESGEEELKRAAAFAGRIGRLPLPVKSSPGFLVNRVLMPYILEAITMVEEGASPREVDKAALGFGMPMGPALLADTVGLDICLHVGEGLSRNLGVTVPETLKEMVKSGSLGKKSGKGFYGYTHGRQVKSSGKKGGDAPADAADRLILSMANEAAACLAEGVVEDAALVDAAMVFGTGFAPFRGGPLNYSISRGIEDVVKHLTGLKATYGERFHPSDGWSSIGPAKAKAEIE